MRSSIKKGNVARVTELVAADPKRLEMDMFALNHIPSAPRMKSMSFFCDRQLSGLFTIQRAQLVTFKRAPTDMYRSHSLAS